MVAQKYSKLNRHLKKNVQNTQINSRQSVSVIYIRLTEIVQSMQLDNFACEYAYC